MATLFMGGLRDDIRAEVMKTDEWDMMPIVDEARNVETSLSDKKRKDFKGTIIASFKANDELDEYISAMFEKTLGVKPGQRLCYECNKPGHFAFRCPKRLEKGKRKRSNVASAADGDSQEEYEDEDEEGEEKVAAIHSKENDEDAFFWCHPN